MITNLMWIVTGASVIGVILNIKKKRSSFVIWFFTNTLWMVYDFSLGAYPQALLFLVYVILAIYGVWEWRKRGCDSPQSKSEGSKPNV